MANYSKPHCLKQDVKLLRVPLAITVQLTDHSYMEYSTLIQQFPNQIPVCCGCAPTYVNMWNYSWCISVGGLMAMYLTISKNPAKCTKFNLNSILHHPDGYRMVNVWRTVPVLTWCLADNHHILNNTGLTADTKFLDNKRLLHKLAGR